MSILFLDGGAGGGGGGGRRGGGGGGGEVECTVNTPHIYIQFAKVELQAEFVQGLPVEPAELLGHHPGQIPAGGQANMTATTLAVQAAVKLVEMVTDDGSDDLPEHEGEQGPLLLPGRLVPALPAPLLFLYSMVLLPSALKCISVQESYSAFVLVIPFKFHCLYWENILKAFLFDFLLVYHTKPYGTVGLYRGPNPFYILQRKKS